MCTLWINNFLSFSFSYFSSIQIVCRFFIILGKFCFPTYIFTNDILWQNLHSHCQDGPDILVCDEAHMIKNTRADTTQALKQVKCQRRIALTGSPLQNNLMEYYCVSLYGKLYLLANHFIFLFSVVISLSILCGTDGWFCKRRIPWK